MLSPSHPSDHTSPCSHELEEATHGANIPCPPATLKCCTLQATTPEVAKAMVPYPLRDSAPLLLASLPCTSFISKIPRGFPQGYFSKVPPLLPAIDRQVLLLIFLI